jgi:TolB-like protein/Tfp pilus assembly protein PilF
MRFDFQIGGWQVQPQLNSISRDTQTIRVEPKMMQVLVLLAQHSGEVVSKEQLVQEVWRDTFVTDDVLVRCISGLRKAFGDDAARSEIIETVSKRGYRLLVPVTANLHGDHSGRVRSEVADSIAILPFENTGHHPDMEYLSDGITETIINNLSKLRGLRVVPRTSVFHYKGRAVNPANIGRDLHVRLVLTGHVVQRGTGLVIGAELIDITNESQIWGETYNCTPDDILSIQDEIASKISRGLQLQMTDAERGSLAKYPTQNREAYHLHLKALYFAQKWTSEGFQKGLEYTMRAIEMDPAYSEAYAGLANLYTAVGMSGGMPPTEAFPRAKAAAIKALEIDDGAANAHAALAAVRFAFDWDLPGTEAESRRAIELGPQLADGHAVYSCWCLTNGLYEEALAEAMCTLDLDPLSATANFHLGSVQCFGRRYDDAIAQFRKTNELDPNFAPAQALAALTYALKGQHAEAILEADKVLQDPEADLRIQAPYGAVCALAGKSDRARKILDRLKTGCKSPYFMFSFECAGIYAVLGEQDRAFEWLDKAFLMHSGKLIYVNVLPQFETLRDDPRFAALLGRIGILPSEKGSGSPDRMLT